MGIRKIRTHNTQVIKNDFLSLQCCAESSLKQNTTPLCVSHEQLNTNFAPFKVWFVLSVLLQMRTLRISATRCFRLR